MAEREYVTLSIFALRCDVPMTKVRRCLDEGIITAAVRKQGGTLIDWASHYKKFLKWCPEAKLRPKKQWKPGKMLDLPDPDDFSEEEEEDTEVEDRITEDMSLEDLEALLKSKCSVDEAKRIRQILAGMREINAMREARDQFIDVAQFIPKFAQFGTLLRNTARAIRPRVATQFAAMTDAFAIGKILDLELENMLSQFDRFFKELGGKSGGK